MKRSLFFSLVALATFVMASVAGAKVESILGRLSERNNPAAEKSAQPFKRGRSVDARIYRSPGSKRKVVVSSDNAEALARARSAGAIELADYGSYKLLLIDQHALDRQVAAMSENGFASHPAARDDAMIVRDDFNVLLLRSGAIDTTAGEAAGRFLGLGRKAAIANNAGSPAWSASKSRSGLRLIQFVGPVKEQWLDALRESGMEPIAYVPNNGYLVRADAVAADRLMRAADDAYARGEGFIQWEGPFGDEHKIHPAIASAVSLDPSAELTVVVQIARSQSDAGAQAADDAAAAKGLASSLIGNPYDVLNYTNVKMRVAAGRINELAALASVVNIEPWEAPQLNDERSSQIVAGELSDDGKQARGPGYLAWLQARGFATPFNFTIDITDTGLDRGMTAADNLHPDFLTASGQSRVTYARDYTTDQDPGDIEGHGTVNASIAAGNSFSNAKDMRDESGFNHGLGVAPFALIGSSKIFQGSGKFDLIEPYTKLISEAYRDGARVSSNSWSAITNSYTIDSQEYDARVRDAVPSQAGNQEMVICFAAGNAGPGGRIGSPGSGKNIITVAAGENARRTGSDGCGVTNEQADSALDMAFFSSGGFTEDGRIKPDFTAPGTHVQGAASQHPDFNGTGVCGEDFDKPYFPQGQTLYTWASGTSQATPHVAGAAALVRQFFLNRGEEASPALTKALLANTATYMTGTGAGGDLPHVRQGWGLMNIGRTFNSVPKIFVNQTHTFGESGQEFLLTGEIKDSAEPVRVTLAWTDAPGLSALAPWVNDLDLEVVVNGQVYRGNNFLGQQSQPGGKPNTKDNIESVWLPAGTVGTFLVRVRASNVAGDGVPGNADFTDQDFALVVYNGERKDAAVAVIEGVAISAGANAAADPGETVSMKLAVKNFSPIALIGGRVSIATSTPGVTLAAQTADLPAIAPNGTAETLTALTFTIAPNVACNSELRFTVDVSTPGLFSRMPLVVAVGTVQTPSFFADDVESGESKWTHGSGIKKKKKRIDTWTLSSRRVHAGARAWFTPALGQLTDSHLDTMPVALPADARNLRLVFFHTFEFESGQFDGAVLEISTGGAFEDLGPKILQGRYTGTIFDFSDNALKGRQGWVEGRLGEFQQVVVDLSSYAGKTVVIRFRVGTDVNVKGQGWYVDDVVITGERATCSPAAAQ